jgi:hypothetical protein
LNPYIQEIRSNIQKCGYHLYVIKDRGPLPKFAYTIGLKEKVGFELVFAGALLLSDSDVYNVIEYIAHHINEEKISEIEVDGMLFLLKPINSSWSKKLLLGALDYYNLDSINALQVIPPNDYLTIDTPNLSVIYNPLEEPIWQWLTEDCSYSIDATSNCVVDLDVLFGKPVIQVTRWEEDYWEAFSKSPSEVAKENTIFIPLGILLSYDKSNRIFAKLSVNQAASRIDNNSHWEFWNTDE